MTNKLIASPIKLSQEITGKLSYNSPVRRNLNSMMNDVSTKVKNGLGFVSSSSLDCKTGQLARSSEQSHLQSSVSLLIECDPKDTKSALVMSDAKVLSSIHENGMKVVKHSQCNSGKENVDPFHSDSFFKAFLADSLCPNITKMNVSTTSAIKKTWPLPKSIERFELLEKGSEDINRLNISSDNTHSSSTQCRATKNSCPGKSGHQFTVSIEGNISSGKSTFLKHFSSFQDVATFQEPLWKWTDVGGHNLLGKLYEDPHRWSFLFQSYVQLTRLNIHLATVPNAKVKLIERSLQNNRYCFVENGHDSGHLQCSEYDVLCEYFAFLEKSLDLGVDLIVYLRTTPEVVHQRMKQRGRLEEAGVPLSYLQRVHDYYEQWLINEKPQPPPSPVLVIDANMDLASVIHRFEANRDFILGKVPYKAKPGDISSSSKSANEDLN